MKRTLFKSIAAATITIGSFAAVPLPSADAVGSGPNPGNGQVQLNRFTTNQELSSFLQSITKKSDALSLEVIGQSVKGRELYLVKAGNNPNNPTVLFLTQQHGNEGLITEGALNFIKKLGTNSKEVRDWLDHVNVLILPRLNPDGAEGDVNFDISHYVGGGQATRFNANGVDLNRDHTVRKEPETKAFHENVLKKYKIDYMIDFHHQGTQSAINNKYVSGSILYPTSPNVAPEVRQMSQQLGSVVYHAIEKRGFGHIGKYVGGTENTIARNGIAAEYGIATLLFEMRGMMDHEREDYVLGQKSNGYLIKQAEIAMQESVASIADATIKTADTSFWENLPEQRNKEAE
ncbi:carboxypeptidase [Bacillus lacus]|uniref:Carboxypeptidase n=1 Tax=Metabacillus lacus TaxID=1983721 RepID=A0A7X2LX75_9BACI|nr:M14 family zinc carboxypeptidase [Metabacillus lacus]MRX72260.1 carboxypeptidase [Metabacillus lacus]